MQVTTQHNYNIQTRLLTLLTRSLGRPLCVLRERRRTHRFLQLGSSTTLAYDLCDMCVV